MLFCRCALPPRRRKSGCARSHHFSSLRWAATMFLAAMCGLVLYSSTCRADHVDTGGSSAKLPFAFVPVATPKAQQQRHRIGLANHHSFTPTVLASFYDSDVFQQRRVLLFSQRQQLASSSLSKTTSTTSTTSLHMSPRSTTSTEDPYVLLGLDPAKPTVDRKEIKRAYKRMALKYHPDVVIKPTSTPQEKRAASDYFAKINAAYELLVGKGSTTSSTGFGAAAKTATTGTAGGYTPPHRRTTGGGGTYASSSSSGAYRRTSNAGAPPPSTDWRDYIPNNDDDDEYDTGGDSFGVIFSDLLTGVAAGTAGVADGGSGVLRDFVEFLEQNVDGFTSGYDSDPALSVLLQTGTFDEIATEMDDTQLLVQQLSAKSDQLKKEIIQIQAELKVSTRYIEKIEYEERIAELQARKDVIEGYVKKTTKRLVKLQTRYKELIVEGRGGRGYDAGTGGSEVGGRSGGSSSDSRGSGGGEHGSSSHSSSPYSSTSSSYSSSSYYGGRKGASTTTGNTTGSTSTTSSSRYASSSGRGSSSGSSAASSPGETSDKSSAWKREGFGSFGRRSGRGTGSRRGRTSSSTTTTATTTAASGGTSSTSTRGGSGGGGGGGFDSSDRNTVGARVDTNRDTASSTSRSGTTRSSDQWQTGGTHSSRSATTTATSSSSSSPSSSPSSYPSQQKKEWTPPVPPHRRLTTPSATSSSSYRQMEEDKKRLRDLRVDEEIEKLKKELGL